MQSHGDCLDTSNADFAEQVALFERTDIVAIRSNADAPHLAPFTVLLLGDSRAAHWAFNGAIEVGNKALVVTGILNLHAPPRSNTKTRLAVSVNPGDETLFLKDVSGITTYTGDQCGGTIRPPKGDLLAIAPSNMCTTCYDTCEVATVGAGTV